MSRSTSAEIAGYLQWRIREWVRGGKTARDLAKLAGISTAQVSELQNAGIGAGWKTAERLAHAFGMSMPELMKAAADWSADRPAVVDANAERSRRRALAVELAREDGVSEKAIRNVLDQPAAPRDSERSTVWWVLQMRRRDLELTEVAPSQASAAARPAQRRSPKS